MRVDRKKFVIAMMDADLNTVQLAERTKLGRPTISAIKNGRSCKLETVIRIAEALGIPVEEILEK